MFDFFTVLMVLCVYKNGHAIIINRNKLQSASVKAKFSKKPLKMVLNFFLGL